MAKTVILEKMKASEKIVRQIEADNILVFTTDRSITKEQIKKEAEKLFDIKIAKVRTHTQNNKKVAYVKLKPEFAAIDVATKLGLM